MRQAAARNFAQRLYRRHHGADIAPNYLSWRSVCDTEGRPLAVLGYRSASDGPLFLERYLDEPIEQMVSSVQGVRVPRHRIVEIGCLAAFPSAALLRLWQLTAASLAGPFDVAVATLTAPLRNQFRRVGLPMHEFGAASLDRAGTSGDDWGRYYAADPVVCMGSIASGATALDAFGDRFGRLR
ncbi:thermostable hemolysin [Sphingomonas oryzagri]